MNFTYIKRHCGEGYQWQKNGSLSEVIGGDKVSNKD